MGNDTTAAVFFSAQGKMFQKKVKPRVISIKLHAPKLDIPP